MEVVWVITWLDSYHQSLITTYSCENSLLTQALPYSHQEHNAGFLTEFHQALSLNGPAVASHAATLKIKLSMLGSPGDALKSYPSHSNNGAVFAE